jgi:hypothetical protein
MDAHEREHAQAAHLAAQAAADRTRARRDTRRYVITTLVALLGSQTVTWVLVAVTHKA